MNTQDTLFPYPKHNENETPTENYKGKPRLKKPVRTQVEMVMTCIDDLIPQDHKVRNVWNYVKSLDLSKFLLKIQSVQGNVGRPATDPHLLLALWLYATIEGIGNGRIIERYCSEHNAFKWLCGGVEVNYHTINDFRINNKTQLDDLLTKSVAVFLSSKLIDLESISQDGVRVRAHAGTSSFRRKETLEDHLIIAREYIETLAKDIEKDPSNTANRKKNSLLLRAKEQENRIQKSLEEMDEYLKKKAETLKKTRHRLTETEIKEARISTTDPEARKIKMANSGFSPAYNVQLATDVKSKLIVGVDVIKSSSDTGLMSLMHQQVINRFNVKPKKHLCDGGYTNHEDIEKTKTINPACKILVPVKNPEKSDSYVPKENDSEIIKEWRINMGTIEVKNFYKNRASTSEFVNAQARNRGLQQFFVRGVQKVLSNVLLFALTHNMVRTWGLL